MSYDDLLERLDADPFSEPRIWTLPDGSVDHCYAVTGLEGDRLASRESFGRQLIEGAGDSFGLEPTTTRSGGQAVNAAIQVDALGAEVTLFGHLEHPLLQFPFETRSMGEPSRIRVLAFGDEEVLLSESSPDAAAWGREEFRAALGPAECAAVDGLCVANWGSYRGVDEVIEWFAGGGTDARERTRMETETEATTAAMDSATALLEGVPLVVDPGALGAASEAALDRLFDALAAADSTLEVVLSVNRAECEAAAAAVGIAVERLDRRGLCSRLRSRLGVSAVVLHGTDVAVAATADGVTGVEMLPVDDVALTTGAGDRFSGALALALAEGWGRAAALALANACAAHFVATGDTAGRGRLEAFVRERR